MDVQIITLIISHQAMPSRPNNPNATQPAWYQLALLEDGDHLVDITFFGPSSSGSGYLSLVYAHQPAAPDLLPIHVYDPRRRFPSLNSLRRRGMLLTQRFQNHPPPRTCIQKCGACNARFASLVARQLFAFAHSCEHRDWKERSHVRSKDEEKHSNVPNPRLSPLDLLDYLDEAKTPRRDVYAPYHGVRWSTECEFVDWLFFFSVEERCRSWDCSEE